MAATKNGDGGDLGRVQLRGENGEVILIPKPSSDPNDPLNWSVKHPCVENKTNWEKGRKLSSTMSLSSLVSACSCVHF